MPITATRDGYLWLECCACRDAKPMRNTTEERLFRKAREAGWTFPRLESHTGGPRRAYHFCPACSKAGRATKANVKYHVGNI